MPLYGPKWPLARGKKDTYQLYGDLKSQIGFYLKNLMLTSPGENLSDPLYGVGLRRFMFANSTSGVSGQIESIVSKQIATYLPYLVINSLDISAGPDEIDNNLLKITLNYSIPDNVENQIFEITTGGTTETGIY